MLQTVEIGEFVQPNVVGVQVSRRYRGRLFQVTKAYGKTGLVGMKVEDVAQVLLLDIENEFRRGFSREYRAYNSFPCADYTIEVYKLLQTYIGLIPRDEELEAADAAFAKEQREKDAKLAKKQVALAKRGAVEETKFDDEEPEW